MSTEPGWYFAYGANMSRRVLARRGVVPRSSEAARLEGWRLRFSHRGLLPIEPAFANIEPCAGATVHGVLHALDVHDLARLDRVEGAEYVHERVTVTGASAGDVAARAYRDPHPAPGLVPSRRYLGACCEGAREHGLPGAWVAELEALPSLHVPVVSDLAAGLVGLAERLRMAGLRPERLRMAARGHAGRRDAPASIERDDGPRPAARADLDRACSARSGPGRSASGRHDGVAGAAATRRGPGADDDLLAALGPLPAFPVRAADLEVTTSSGPTGLHAELRRMLRGATRRIVLASLYVGTGALERELQDDVRHALARSPDLRVELVIDHSRGRRTTENGTSASSVQALVREHPARVTASLHRMPQLEGARGWLPSPLDECVAVFHLKVLVADDAALLTGANLSDEYFRCRQARSIVVRDARLCDLLQSVTREVARRSLRLRPDGRLAPPELSPRTAPAAVLARLADVPPAAPGHDTWITGLLQHPAQGVQQERQLLRRLLAAPAGELALATPYANFPPDYADALAARGARTLVLVPSADSHSFTTGRGLKALVPGFYLQREQELARRLGERADIRRWTRPGWVFHAKGAWLRTATETATVIGSSSFGERSVARDFDLSHLIVTRDPALRRALDDELASLCSLAERAPATSRVPRGSRVIAPWIKSFM